MASIERTAYPRFKRSPSARELETALLERLPERNVIDVLGNVAHWTSWNRHFGPLSGSAPKIDNPGERCILTTLI